MQIFFGPMGAEGNKSLVFIRIFLRDLLYLDTPYGIQCQNEDTTLGTFAIEFKNGLAISRKQPPSGNWKVLKFLYSRVNILPNMELFQDMINHDTVKCV